MNIYRDRYACANNDVFCFQESVSETLKDIRFSCSTGTAEQLWDWGGGGGTISASILGGYRTHFKNIGGGARVPRAPPTPRSL